jgi:pimeloyl-ACP methyl ester carboxylesterase
MVSRTDTTDFLSRIGVPTLVMVGSADRLTPPAVGREIAGRIPNSVFVEIAGAGHLSSIESPVEFNRVLRKYLERLRPDD